MLNISYKAAYSVLDTHYACKSLNGYLERDIHTNILAGSEVFAAAKQDYEYLGVMRTKRADFDREYALFLDHFNDVPIVLTRNKELSVLDFAMLSITCDDTIAVHVFEDTIEAQATGKHLEKPEQYIAEFRDWIAQIRDMKPDSPEQGA